MEKYLLSSQKDAINHGDQLAPYSYYHCIIPTVLPDVLLHWHVEVEVTFVRDGSATYQIGEETFHSQKGDLIFISPNTLHSVYPIAGLTQISDTLVFHLDLLGYSVMDQCTLTYLRPLFNGSLRLLSHINQNHPSYLEMSACINEIFICIKNKDTYLELILKEKLYHLLYLLFKYQCFMKTNISGTTSIYMGKIKTVLQYIQDNYKESISILELAGLCHFSKTHFMSLFKQTVGISCVEYIIQVRLRVANELLRQLIYPSLILP
ncbi:AraC family transcriptional regulator [Clostridium uliginosum]|uniref:Regulatory helix-turn-helix protein, AraC family n=1 Tax=Clostridium uliginosum TaxID=119641 RepID=A0A1I1MSZ5_9CLOT|nr:AraC family transcriptional regulator [Clostridium uliginosum]SFC88256.1 regulatory helix-turn-helix protein, AraC family [Clostridium uliginosum]